MISTPAAFCVSVVSSPQSSAPCQGANRSLQRGDLYYRKNFICDTEVDIEAGEGHTVYAVRVVLIGGARITGKDLF